MRESAPRTVTSPSSSPMTLSHSHGATLHLDVPTFDGDPFEWANFETMFKASMKTRARGHTKLEIKGHLIKAVKHPEGQKILQSHTDPNPDIDTILAELREKFGSPQVLCPLIIARIQRTKHTRMTATDMDAVRDNLLLPYQSLKDLIGDSLSSYLAMFFVGTLDPETNREWLRVKEPGTVPNMDTVAKFVKYWQTELQRPANHLQLPTSSSAPPPYSSSASHHNNPPAKQKFGGKTRGKKQPSCPACNETHVLFKCSSFQNMDLDSRNKLVRDKRLCVNCFSSQHNHRNCPSRFSCKTCGAKHHTILHTEPQSSTATEPIAAQMLIPLQDSSTAHNDGSPSRVRFLYTALVTLKHGGQSVVARAVLDTGAAVSIMSDRLATDLRLERTHNPLTVQHGDSIVRCKFTVETPLHSADGSFTSAPIQFQVHPGLPYLDSPPNKDEIAATPSLAFHKLADPELGGRVDLLLNGMDATCVESGPYFKIGTLLCLPTRFGLCLSRPMVGYSAASMLTMVAAPTNLNEDLERLWELLTCGQPGHRRIRSHLPTYRRPFLRDSASCH